MNQEVKVIPLGGLGEVGMNMMAFETEEDIIVVDCGLLFPDETMLGVDLVIPDATYLFERREKVRAIILTHGHEDHSGALPFIWPEIRCPVYATEFNQRLLAGRLREFAPKEKLKIKTIKAGDIIEPCPSFSIEFYEQIHSIPDCLGLAIETPAGLIVYTADFKFRKKGREPQALFDRMHRYRDQGVLALFSDSTNIEREGFAGDEEEAAEGLRQIFRSAEGRVVVTCFASAIFRIQKVLDIARKNNRKVFVTGKSMIDNIRIARELGHLKAADDQFISRTEIYSCDKKKVCILTTGSQGEPLSALTRISFDDHKQVSIEPEDTVILSSRIIPGNERSVNRVIDNLYRRQARVYYERIAHVHVSGHACRGEQRKMIEMLEPKYFVPIHGEFRHLTLHAELAREAGVEAENAIVAQDGDIISITPESISVVGRAPRGRVFVDGKGVGDIADVVLRDRRRLGNDGIVVAMIALDAETGAPVGEINLFSLGCVGSENGEEIFDQAREEIAELLEKFQKSGSIENADVAEEIRILLRRIFRKKLSRRPVVIPLVLNV